jgi:hypothetical protein
MLVTWYSEHTPDSPMVAVEAICDVGVWRSVETRIRGEIYGDTVCPKYLLLVIRLIQSIVLNAGSIFDTRRPSVGTAEMQPVPRLLGDSAAMPRTLG